MLPTRGGVLGGNVSRLFQRAPTLGGECYVPALMHALTDIYYDGFNGHPPLGVNATRVRTRVGQRHLRRGFNGHPPLGVNATSRVVGESCAGRILVSTGTHPWG